MKEIGAVLKARREQLSMTLEQAGKSTKTSVSKLEAIEDGNLDFFKDDLSYLKYYVGFYFKFLGLNFDRYRDDFFTSLDQHDQTMEMSKIEENIRVNENIKKRIESTPKIIKKKSIDYSMISLIGIIIVMLCALMWVGFNHGSDMFSTEPTPPVSTMVPTAIPTATPTATSSPSQDAVNNVLNVSQEDEKVYIIKDYQEGQEVKIDVNFGTDTWARVLVNDVVTNNPASMVYMNEESMQIIVNAEDDVKISIHLGIFESNSIYINGELLILDEAIVELASGQQIDIIFKGE